MEYIVILRVYVIHRDSIGPIQFYQPRKNYDFNLVEVNSWEMRRFQFRIKSHFPYLVNLESDAAILS